ncbi:MAG TPA: energy transducer TonB, partial [Luteimonas sp.]|nr:energy transducer TonB [Luteimonas sp.]
PVVFADPSPVATPAPPPAPPAPPQATPDIGASVDISSKNMNPPQYPPAAARAGIEGTVVLIIDVDANGNVTDVAVEKSSRNRDLDRAAMQAARRWSFRPSIVNGQPAAGRVRVPVDFRLGG